MNTPRFIRPATFAALFFATAIPGVLRSDDAPTPTIQSITYGGTGAPQGTVGQSISNDREVFTLVFDQFVASTGPGVPITESRKAAQLNYNLSSPHRPARLTETLRGYVQLPAGVTATVQITTEGGKTKTSSAKFVGPLAKDYIFTDETHLRRDAAVENVKVSVELSGPASAQAQITLDSLDGKISGGDEDGD